ncbi:hypothetical protein [Glycomyces sp. MUSA5-2]|uniref:hypothetical protein n=1 Tax=Glycomyces sp. MUSA5-2 TaxID=2053002 RepID=UPI00300935D5
MDTSTTLALTGLWEAIRAHHPRLPPVTIVRTDPDQLRRDPAWGHAVFHRAGPAVAGEATPDLFMAVAPSNPGTGVETHLIGFLHDAAHGLASTDGVVDWRPDPRPAAFGRPGGRHLRSFARYAETVGLQPHRTFTEDGWGAVELAPGTRDQYAEVLAAVNEAEQAARTRTPAAGPDWVVAYCACDEHRYVVAEAAMVAHALPTCSRCGQPYRAVDPAAAGLGAAVIDTHAPGPGDALLLPAVSASLYTFWDAISGHHPDLPDARIVYRQPPRQHTPYDWGHRTDTGIGPLGEQETQLHLGILEIQDASAEALALTVLHDAAHGIARTRHLRETGTFIDWLPAPVTSWHNRRFRTVAAEVGLVCDKVPGRGWIPVALDEAARARYRDQLADLDQALDSARREVFPVRLSGICGCWPLRPVRTDSRTLADAPPHCPVCDQGLRPHHTTEL